MDASRNQSKTHVRDLNLIKFNHIIRM